MEKRDLDLMAFGLNETARLSGLSPWQVTNWSDLVTPSWKSGFYTFRDLVSLRTLKRLQEVHGVSTVGLRRARDYLLKHSDAPFSELTIGVGPKNRLYFFDKNTGGWESADAVGQRIAKVALDHVAAELQKAVKESRTRPKEFSGEFERKRGVCAGKWRFKGTRIPVDLVLDMLRRKAKVQEILDDFPTLTRQDVAAARGVLAGNRKLSAA